jgi:hypothetical protein
MCQLTGLKDKAYRTNPHARTELKVNMSREMLDVTQEEVLWENSNLFCIENFRMGTRGNAKTQREMDRYSKMEHDKTWTDRRGY